LKLCVAGYPKESSSYVWKNIQIRQIRQFSISSFSKLFSENIAKRDFEILS